MRSKRVIAAVLALGALLAACGDDSSDDASEGSTTAATNGIAADTDGSDDTTEASNSAAASSDTTAETTGETTTDDTTDGDTTNGDTTNDETTNDGEPVVVEHRFGETDVEGVPERIVTLDMQWTDVLLAMGVEPVGAVGDSYGTDDGRFAWQQGLIGADVMLDGSNGPPLEAIAALEPDLIVGSWPIEDQQTYELLSEIAPTIATLDAERQVDNWQDLTTAAGEFLRDEQAADDVIAEVDTLIEETRQALPGLQGKTFALSQYVVGDALYVVADANDGSTTFFEDLGMTMAPSVVELAGGEARPSLSPEEIDVLDADFLVFHVNGGDESNLTDLPGWDLLPSVQNDAAVLLDYHEVSGVNTPTPLSIPYSLDAMMPALEAAAG